MSDTNDKYRRSGSGGIRSNENCKEVKETLGLISVSLDFFKITQANTQSKKYVENESVIMV